MSHLKRQMIPKNWPVPRKGTKYVSRPNFALKMGMPLLIILRDMLKIAKNRKEVKRAIHEKNILINGKIIIDDKTTVQLFDKITIVPSKKHYKLDLSKKGKFALDEINEKEANEKIAKIINKKILKGKKVQLNLGDGRNFISDMKCKVNDSVSINLKNRKIQKCVSLEKNAKAIVVAGKHAGERGIIMELKPKRKMVELKVKDKKMNILIKQIIVIE